MANQETTGARAILAADAILQWKSDPKIREQFSTVSDYYDSRAKVFDLNLIRPFKPKPTPIPVPNNILTFNPRKQL